MHKCIGLYPRARVQDQGPAGPSQTGGLLLVETVRKAGLDTVISTALVPWRKPRAVQNPSKVLLDLALTVTLDVVSLGNRHERLAPLWPIFAGLRLLALPL
ncbi:hypothetical protein [Candidatus Frankia alpina]|uniref:hypothetical protein n=1 Tax=Candidatus Frankia alpina TaxID=2699483 RepID=UPI001386C017